ncbi:molybdopterin-dependent oxidoreductase [Dyadobacter sp. CY312]|uniref:molybdopterin-dependent oxidoreductase n=1 Tax=Dyadobacter sp. CY312 TaxID=2907303 RepID=UPI001F2DBAAE|nr:molybdopterin-dependent oxidoreductase [Dyadobacter sp. CY312]MCE7038766.1 molybdopterin-dependent oxidoreductase [Dyadobacter sp. CY312]
MFLKKTLFATLVIQLFCVVTLWAQTESTLAISGEVSVPLTLKKSDLAAFETISHKVKDRDGKEHEFKGVALFELLKKAGVSNGAQLRGENLVKYVLIQAADGYEVLYALPEIDPDFTDQIILLATEKDGKALENGEGPFRIITPNDKKQARWIREVRSIKVGFAKE